ncbi:MAG: hypothetical protein VB141_11480 [Burkholderia gladioli]
MELMSTEMNRRDLESKLGLRKKDATREIRKLIRDGALQSELKYVDPTHCAKRERRYAFVAQTAELF